MRDLIDFAGCAKRVALPQPPPRDAPLEQRLEAFEKLAPIGEERVVMLQGGTALLSGNLTLTAIGIGLVAVSGIVMLATIIPLVMAVVVSNSASADRSAAFLAYTKSLRERLALTDADLRNPPERGPPRPEPSTLNSLERTWPRPASASLVVWAF